MLITLTLAMSLFMSSCSDDEKTTGPSDQPLGELTAKIAGSDWKVSNAEYLNEDFVIVATENVGTGTDANSISIQFEGLADGEAPVVKTYTTSNEYVEIRTVEGTTVFNIWGNESATTVVTAVTSTSIKGTFSFTGTNTEDNTTKVVTGSFNVPRK